MSFESPLGYEQKHVEPPLRGKAGVRALLWMGTFLTVTGAAKLAEADTAAESHEKAHAAESMKMASPFTYEGTMLELPRDGNLDIEPDERKELPDGKIVRVYKGVNPLPDAEVADERVIDVHVLDDRDSRVKGDERWVECQVTVKTYSDADRPKDYGYLCLDSASDIRASGLHMDSPVGAFEFYGPNDKEYATMGAFPKTEADLKLYELNNLYWALRGLKEAGADQDEAAVWLKEQFLLKASVARNNERTHPIDEAVIEEFKP